MVPQGTSASTIAVAALGRNAAAACDASHRWVGPSWPFCSYTYGQSISMVAYFDSQLSMYVSLNVYFWQLITRQVCSDKEMLARGPGADADGRAAAALQATKHCPSAVCCYFDLTQHSGALTQHSGASCVLF